MGGMGHIPASLPQLREKAQAVKKAEDVVKQARVIMGIWGSFLLEPLCWQGRRSLCEATASTRMPC